MNKEIRSVRLSDCTTVSITLLNATEESMETLLVNAKRFSDESFKMKTQTKDVYKKVIMVFHEPRAAKHMLQFVINLMYGPER